LGKFEEVFYNNYIHCNHLNKFDKVKLIDLIVNNDQTNDILAHCITENGKSHSIIPLTALCFNPIPDYKPKKFVYEYNDWKKYLIYK